MNFWFINKLNSKFKTAFYFVNFTFECEKKHIYNKIMFVFCILVKMTVNQ